MGNCFRHEKSISWADDDDDDDDDWGSLVSTQKQGDDDDGEINIVEKKKKLVGGNGGHANTREVKITISKKELEQLVQKVEMMHGLSLEQVLVRMVKGEGVYDLQVEQHRSWKPALQTIPEVN
ncbi:hypothetical protein PTKIN_Ptkin18bG0144000 [Pterospermum kingtungense]